MASDPFHDFELLRFPTSGRIVYILGLVHEESFVPFYVGESERHVGRVGDYITASFNASTDFHIGEAIKFLHSRGYEVQFRYKVSTENKAGRIRQENELIDQISKMKPNSKLLNNNLGSYNPELTKPEDESKKVHDFMKEFLASLQSRI
jgi:hypothetical protein